MAQYTGTRISESKLATAERNRKRCLLAMLSAAMVVEHMDEAHQFSAHEFQIELARVGLFWDRCDVESAATDLLDEDCLTAVGSSPSGTAYRITRKGRERMEILQLQLMNENRAEDVPGVVPPMSADAQERIRCAVQAQGRIEMLCDERPAVSELALDTWWKTLDVEVKKDVFTTYFEVLSDDDPQPDRSLPGGIEEGV